MAWTLMALSPRAPGKLRRELGLPPHTRIVGMVAYMYAPERFLGQTRASRGTRT